MSDTTADHRLRELAAAVAPFQTRRHAKSGILCQAEIGATESC